ncbi:hypothetical protein [Brucella sp. IR073]|uniref:hypothetical protein n=1 Tax=unclassified Brucella TaxID=2632610 RepID=UPI003B97DE7F
MQNTTNLLVKKVATMPLNNFMVRPEWAAAGAHCAYSGDQLEIRGTSAPWEYSAAIKFYISPVILKSHIDLFLRVRISDVKNNGSVALIDLESNTIYEEISLWETEGEVDIDFIINPISSLPSHLLIRNGFLASSSLVIHSLNVMAFSAGHTFRF